MGYCCGGIETFPTINRNNLYMTTWVTAAAVLRLCHFFYNLNCYDHMGYCCGGIETRAFVLE